MNITNKAQKYEDNRLGEGLKHAMALEPMARTGGRARLWVEYFCGLLLLRAQTVAANYLRMSRI